MHSVRAVQSAINDLADDAGQVGCCTVLAARMHSADPQRHGSSREAILPDNGFRQGDLFCYEVIPILLRSKLLHTPQQLVQAQRAICFRGLLIDIPKEAAEPLIEVPDDCGLFGIQELAASRKSNLNDRTRVKAR